MIETQLIEKKDLREQVINNVEVLNKVKKLFLIPEMNVMTTKMVADYYEVGLEAIQSCYKDNKNEIDLDGVCIKPYKDFLSVLKGQVTIENGKTTIDLSDTIKLVVPRRGVKVFPQRAILRIGMLLRDSLIAKEVRTQLLNIFEHSTNKQKTTEIDKELKFQADIGKAYLNGDKDEFTRLNMEYIAYKNRYIKKVEKENVELSDINDKLKNKNKKLKITNALLSRKAVEWGNRPILNALMRKYAMICFSGKYKFSTAWKTLYRQVKYNCGWDIEARVGTGSLINRIKENEFPDIIKIAVGLCEANHIDVGKTINAINVENIKKFQ